MNHWTLDKCKVDAANYKKRGEWAKKSPNAYSASARNNWLDLCCPHMPKPKKLVKRKPLKWHKLACMEEARRYESRSEFYRESGSAYNSAKNNFWLDECCSHMSIKKGGSTKRKKISQYWDLESCREEAKKFTTISDWNLNSGSSYQAAIRNNWVELCASRFKARNTRIEKVREVCRVEINKFNCMEELKSTNPALGEIIDILGLSLRSYTMPVN
jgi:hypothetical protein